MLNSKSYVQRYPKSFPIFAVCLVLFNGQLIKAVLSLQVLLGRTFTSITTLMKIRLDLESGGDRGARGWGGRVSVFGVPVRSAAPARSRLAAVPYQPAYITRDRDPNDFLLTQVCST